MCPSSAGDTTASEESPAGKGHRQLPTIHNVEDDICHNNGPQIKSQPAMLMFHIIATVNKARNLPSPSLVWPNAVGALATRDACMVSQSAGASTALLRAAHLDPFVQHVPLSASPDFICLPVNNATDPSRRESVQACSRHTESDRASAFSPGDFAVAKHTLQFLVAPTLSSFHTTSLGSEMLLGCPCGNHRRVCCLQHGESCHAGQLPLRPAGIGGYLSLCVLGA